MKAKILVCALLALILPAIHLAEAQQQEKIPRIGFLQRRVTPTTINPDPLAEAFLQGLKDLGYVDGQNILIEHRYAEGRTDRLPGLVSELLQLKVDVIVVASARAIRVAKKATQTIPIVIVTQANPVGAGFVESLAHPGGNITGLTRLTSELSGKRLELLKEAVPTVSHVGILSGGTSASTAFKDYDRGAHAFNITLQLLKLHGPKPDLEGTFEAAVKEGVNALIINRDAVTASNSKRIADLAIKRHLPSMAEDSAYLEAGGLMSYATDDAEQFKRAAIYVDKILKGAKPANLPVERPTKFEFVVNLKTAKQLGITIPPNVLARAQKVIQ